MRKTFAWLLPVYRSNALLMVSITLLTLVYTVLHLAYPYVIKMVIDGIKADLSVSGIARNAWLLAAVGGGSVLVYMALQAGRGIVNIVTERMARLRAFDRLTLLGDSFYGSTSSGDVITRLTNDISEKIAWFSCSGVFRMVEAVLTICVALAVMFTLNWKLTVVAVIPLPLVMLAFRVLQAKFRRGFEGLQKTASRQNEVLESALSGIKIIKSCADEDRQRARYAVAAAQRVKAEVKMAAMHGLFHNLGDMIAGMGTVAMLFVGALMVVKGTLTIGELVAFSVYMGMIVEPIWSIGFFLPAMRRAEVSVGRLLEIEEARRDVEDAPSARGLTNLAGSVVFENVSYSHKSGAGVSGVSLSAPAGTRLGVVGRIGSGKSTLLDLLPRAFDPSAGRVTLDGTDSREMTLDSLRRAIGYVPQEPFLFTASIRENILLGREDVSDSDLASAVRASRLETDLACFTSGLDEVVGPRGTTLSGGQKQRVSLARALAGRPKILALDDVTSNLDSETEEALWKSIGEEYPNVTIVAVSHRAATSRRMDRIAVLSSGKVVEEGTHDGLLEAGGEYAAIFSRQVLREDLTAQKDDTCAV